MGKRERSHGEVVEKGTTAMTTMSEDDDFEMIEDDDEEERCREGSLTYQRILALPTFSRQDWQRLLRDIHHHRPEHYAIAHTMVDLGLPLVAVLGLSIGNLDLKEHVVRVVQGWGETGAFPIPNLEHPFHPHGDLGQLIVPLTSQSQQVLRDHLAELHACGRPCDASAWLFPGRGNQPWKFRYVTNYTLLAALKRCGLPQLFPKEFYYCIYKTRIEEDSRHDCTK